MDQQKKNDLAEYRKRLNAVRNFLELPDQPFGDNAKKQINDALQTAHKKGVNSIKSRSYDE